MYCGAEYSGYLFLRRLLVTDWPADMHLACLISGCLRTLDARIADSVQEPSTRNAV